MVVLKNIIRTEFYVHFLTLSVAIRILSDPRMVESQELVSYADELLRHFVSESSGLYMKFFVSYNVHSLKHLADDVREMKLPLPRMDAFAFENYLGVLKRFVRKAQSPCSQVVKRVVELEKVGKEVTDKYQMKIKTTFRDSWYMLDSGDIVKLVEVRDDTISGKLVKTSMLESFFMEPLDSKKVGVFKFESLKLALCRNFVVSVDKIKNKMVCIPHNQYYCLSSMLHRLSESCKES